MTIKKASDITSIKLKKTTSKRLIAIKYQHDDLYSMNDVILYLLKKK